MRLSFCETSRFIKGQLSIWEIPEIALLSRDGRGVEGDDTLPMEQEGEIRVETEKRRMGKRIGRRKNHAKEIMSFIFYCKHANKQANSFRKSEASLPIPSPSAHIKPLLVKVTHTHTVQHPVLD